MEIKNVATFLSLAGLSFGIGGCSGKSESTAPMSPDAIASQGMGSVKDYGEGVFVFSSKGFPETLSRFRKDRPELRVISVTQGEDIHNSGFNDSDSRSFTFVVVAEPKK